MTRRSPPRKVTYFEPVPPRLARNTIIESTVEVGRRFRCTMRVDCGALDPGAVIQAIPGEWQANLLIDGTAIGLEGPGMPGFDLAKHRADEPVEEIDGLVCQIGDQVERNSDQGRVTALTFVAGDMLYRGTAGLAGELGKAALMHAMSAGGIDADRANMVQTLDQTQHRGRLCRLRYLAQPDKTALTAFRAAVRQSIEPPPLLGQQPAGQPTFNLSSCLMTQVDAEAFEGSG
jgi:hypothetical protein